jgi:NTE family protein
VVDLQEGLFKERGGYGLEEAACPNSDLLEVFPARFKGAMEKAWYCHERGFDVFVLPALKEAEYWEALENNLAFIMDLLREKSDYVFFNIPVSFRPVGERVVRLCDRALVLLNNQEGALPEVRECVLKTVELMRGRWDHVRVGVSHLVGDRGIPRRDLAEALGLPETPMIWVGRENGPWSGLIETDKSFPVRGARALARELGGVRVGLVLGAGGARGWAHLGVIKVLEEEGIPIDMIVGSSVGSMVGCLYAYSASIDETIGLVMERLPGRFRARRRLFDYTFPLHGIIRGAKIRRMTREAVRGADFLDLKIPVYVVAVDFHTGGEVVLERGDVTEAVRASISLPGIMNPVFHEGRWLLDGGLISPVPVDVAVQKGADTIIAVCVERGKSGLGKRSHKAPGIMSVMSRTMNIIHAHATRDFAQKADIVLYPDVEQFHWDDFHKVSRLIKAGEEACRAKLDEIRAAVSC